MEQYSEPTIPLASSAIHRMYEFRLKSDVSLRLDSHSRRGAYLRGPHSSTLCVLVVCVSMCFSVCLCIYVYMFF